MRAALFLVVFPISLALATTHVSTAYFAADLPGTWSAPEEKPAQESYQQFVIECRDRDAGIILTVTGEIPRGKDKKKLLKDFATLRRDGDVEQGGKVSPLAPSPTGWRFSVEDKDGRVRELITVQRNRLLVVSYMEAGGGEDAKKTDARAEAIFRAFGDR